MTVSRVARASPAAPSGQRSAFSSDCVAGQLVIVARLAYRHVQECSGRNRGAKREPLHAAALRFFSHRKKKLRPHGTGVCLLVALALGLGWAAPARAGDRDQAYTLVKEGRELFDNEKFTEAQEKFQAAELLEPESSLIAYNRARTYHAAGDLEKAREFYSKARATTDVELIARIAFNLADLEVLAARSQLGDKPEAVAGEARKEILDHLYGAVARYRSVLEVKSDDPDARYNIELIRLFVKDLEDRWRKADREKARNEADLLGFLDYLRKVQKGLMQQTDRLQRADEVADRDRPVRLEEVRIVQEELQGEIPHLKTKVREFFDKAGQAVLNPPGGPGPNTPDPKQLESLKEAEEELLKLVDATDQAMGRAGEALREVKLAEARTAQKNAHESLDTMWRSVADFGAVLGRAIAEQNAIVSGTEPLAEVGDDPKPDVGADPTRVEEEKRAARVLIEDQQSVRELVPILEKRAQQALEQLKSMPAQGGAQGGQTPAGQPDPEALKKAFQKTLELLPDADRAMQAAALALGPRTWEEALKEEKEAARILDEIQKLFPKQQQQKKGDQKQEPQKKESEQDQEKKKQDAKKPEPDSKKLDRDEAERRMRQMREKRNKREKKRREAVGGPRIRVEKDW